MEFGLRQQDAAACIEAAQELFVHAVEGLFAVISRRAIAEAHQIERGGGHALEVGRIINSTRQPLPDADVLTDEHLQTFHSIAADNEP